jgi:hypothetical protein
MHHTLIASFHVHVCRICFCSTARLQGCLWKVCFAIAIACTDAQISDDARRHYNWTTTSSYSRHQVQRYCRVANVQSAPILVASTLRTLHTCNLQLYNVRCLHAPGCCSPINLLACTRRSFVMIVCTSIHYTTYNKLHDTPCSSGSRLDPSASPCHLRTPKKQARLVRLSATMRLCRKLLDDELIMRRI